MKWDGNHGIHHYTICNRTSLHGLALTKTFQWTLASSYMYIPQVMLNTLVIHQLWGMLKLLETVAEQCERDASTSSRLFFVAAISVPEISRTVLPSINTRPPMVISFCKLWLGSSVASFRPYIHVFNLQVAYNTTIHIAATFFKVSKSILFPWPFKLTPVIRVGLIQECTAYISYYFVIKEPMWTLVLSIKYIWLSITLN